MGITSTLLAGDLRRRHEVPLDSFIKGETMTIRNLRSMLTITLFATTAAACAETAEEAAPIPAPLSEQASEQSVRGEVGDVVPGEKPGDVNTQAGCVYIQWCNAPGADGTVCRLYSGCSVNNATLQECVDDAYAVCGAPVNPWRLYY
jgi:hypothetical protein